jgi:hypothetical protein
MKMFVCLVGKQTFHQLPHIVNASGTLLHLLVHFYPNNSEIHVFCRLCLFFWSYHLDNVVDFIACLHVRMKTVGNGITM